MKKAQITFFVIIGVILVMIIGTLVFVTIPSSPLSTPAEFGPVEIILNSCTEEVMIENLRKSALSGGNIELGLLTEGITSSDLSLFSNQPVAFTNNLEVVPLLLYYDMPCTSSNCIKTLKPKLNGDFDQRQFSYDSNDKSVEAQLSRASSDMIIDCIEDRLNNNELFSVSNLNIGLKNIINNNGVSYEVRLSGIIKRGTTAINNIYGSGSISSSFKSLYDAAGSLIILESDSGYSSFMIMDILSLESSPRGKYPPLWALDLGYGINSWNSNSVSDNLKDDMNTYFSLIRLSDTELINSMSNLDVPYVLKRSIIDIKNTENNELFGNNMILSYVPSYHSPELSFSGKNVIRGEPLPVPLPLISSILPLRSYRTYYNIKTPIIYELQSKDDGLVFRYAIQSLINSNLPVYANSFPIIPTSSDIVFDTPEKHLLADAFCDYPKGSNLKVNIFDGSSGGSIDNALIIFSCEQTSCSYEYDGNPLRVPGCMNAAISVFYEDYTFNVEEVDTFDYYSTKTVTFEGYESKPIRVNIALLPAILTSSDPYYSFASSSPRNIQNEEVAILSLRNIDSGTAHATVITSTGMQQPLLLTQGNYEIDVIVMRDLSDKVIIIPESERCGWGIPYTPLCMGRHTIDEININSSLMLSTVSFDSSEALYVSSSVLDALGSINMLIPVTDLESISQANRMIEHLSLLGETDLFMRNHGILEVS